MNNAHNTTVATLRTSHCSLGLECQFGFVEYIYGCEHTEQRALFESLIPFSVADANYTIQRVWRSSTFDLRWFLHCLYAIACVVTSSHLCHLAMCVSFVCTRTNGWSCERIHAHRRRCGACVWVTLPRDFTIKYRVRATNTSTVVCLLLTIARVFVLYTKIVYTQKNRTHIFSQHFWIIGQISISLVFLAFEWNLFISFFFPSSFNSMAKIITNFDSCI